MPSKDELKQAEKRQKSAPANGDSPDDGGNPTKGDSPGENGGSAVENRDSLVETQEKMLDSAASSKTNATVPSRRDSKTNEIEAKEEFEDAFWEPKPPKVLMRDPKSVPLELHSQIQQYGTNE